MAKPAISPANRADSLADLPLQPASYDIWQSKYRLCSQAGEPIDETVHDTFCRVARALAECEAPKQRKHWYERFLWALEQGATPAGRILSNLGAEKEKPATSTINCTVSGTIHDSLDGILQRVHEAGLTLKAGCGIGYDFSTLRPKGAMVIGAGAYTSGPLSFMDIYNSMCFTISSAGGRRGAQMGVFDICHPDIETFIRAKREDGRLRQFNLSCLITDQFLEAVEADADWSLYFPALPAEIDNPEFEIQYHTWPAREDYYQVNEQGEVACRVYKTIKARQLWNLIMASTYDFAEPGFVLIDRVNEQNNNWYCENIRTTNPCGEQPLPPYGACLLGSINLTRFVRDPFTDQASFDWDTYREVVAVFSRMLDNVVEVNGLPLEEQRAEISAKRRHGMGFFGLGSAVTMLTMRYGSPESLEFTEQVAREMAEVGWRTGIELAEEKGPAPILEQPFTLTPEMFAKRPELAEAGHKVGDQLPGKVLMGKFSRYMAQFDDELREQIATKGCRYTHHSSIAPTGTISLSIGNNVSNGIEPSFSHSYTRNVIQHGRKTKEKMEVLSYELLAYRELVDPDATPETLPDYFVSADSIGAREHIDVQAAAQRWIDSSISKTANVPTDYPFDQFQDIYMYAWHKQLKGCTTFRFNPEAFQGVLVRDEDLAKTTYEFTLEDGSTVRARGDETIEYEGEEHTAANLFDALKEGYYGRF